MGGIIASIATRTDKQGRRKYDVRIRIRGHAIQTGTFDRLTDANQWVQLVESEIRMGKRLPTKEARKRTLAEAIDRYIDTTMKENAFFNKTSFENLPKSKLNPFRLISPSYFRVI